MKTVPLRRRVTRWVWRGSASVLVLGGVLSIPECPQQMPERPQARAFVWDADARWAELERRYRDGRGAGCSQDVGDQIQRVGNEAAALRTAAPEDPGWSALEDEFFTIAASLGGCPERVADLLAAREQIRTAAKEASRHWPKEAASRDRLYRLLYGTRAAVEELLLQLPGEHAPSLSLGQDVPSSTPSAVVEGVRIHSGDLLVSRGGAPTSAFIARGNDYPGNFSHVALVHVDEATSQPSVIEAHIERGVTVSDAATYMADKKLRILVLRLRPDHPAMNDDPSLPHRAATDALREARARHIPYDFAMDTQDHAEQFCSEVASAAYEEYGVNLWPQLSTFSSEGLARWMAGFGVRHLQTHAPSDLEYDPQLQVVAEWHDQATLLDDHVDNAVIDVMVEQAESGAELDHDASMLPIARLAKGYSRVLELFGAEGPVPEGMSATVALRARWLAERHAAIKAAVLAEIERARASNGYTPPYWELVRFARAAAE